MVVTFDKEYLRDLYETGNTKEKKRRYQPDIIKRYRKVITILRNASSIQTLWKLNSLNYEVLEGDKAGISSVRVNDQYRVEFTVSESENKPVVTICNILELSNHYKK